MPPAPLTQNVSLCSGIINICYINFDLAFFISFCSWSQVILLSWSNCCLCWRRSPRCTLTLSSRSSPSISVSPSLPMGPFPLRLSAWLPRVPWTKRIHKGRWRSSNKPAMKVTVMILTSNNSKALRNPNKRAWNLMLHSFLRRSGGPELLQTRNLEV